MALKKYSFKTSHGNCIIEAQNKKTARRMLQDHFDNKQLPPDVDLILRANNGNTPEKLSFGIRAADTVTQCLGSWKFIITQSCALIIWMILNALFNRAWDPYPFILLNLVLSLQAAYAAPIIMMSQNRQANKDRLDMKRDSTINKANLLIDKQTNENIAEILYLLVDYRDNIDNRFDKIEKFIKSQQRKSSRKSK